MDDVTEPIVEEFNGWLAGLFESEGSDLHVKVGSPPMIRMPGRPAPRSIVSR